MLRVTVQSDPAIAKSYFQAKSHDYYVLGAEEPGVWRGEGARLLGLEGEVQKRDWDRLCDNKYPATGKRLTERDREGRRVLYDFTFSMPKSCTLAAQLSGDGRITGAFELAVTETMAEIEQELLTRNQRGGETVCHATGNLTWAMHRHATSRPVNGIADPQSHIHAFAVINATNSGGRWTALELETVVRDRPYWEAACLSRFSHSLTMMGYAVERKGTFFELKGLGKPLLDKYSRRTKLIESLAEERGITDPKRLAELGGKTRERKAEGTSLSAMQAEWQSRLTDSDKRQLAGLLDQHAELPTLQESVAYALSHCFERSSVVAPRKVYETALRYGYGSIQPEEVAAEAHAQGLIVRGGISTTREALLREERLVQWARDGKDTVLPFCPDFQAPAHLTRGQANAARHALNSKNRLVLIQGIAGAGKTTMLKEVAANIAEPVLGVAISTGATDELRQVTPHAATVAAYLSSRTLQREFPVILLDEASLIGTVQMEQLTQAAKRIIMVGDTQQHSSVLAGSPFQAVQRHAGLPVARVTEVVRQKFLYKEVAERFAAGKSGAALDLMGAMGWAKDYSPQALANDYLWALDSKMSVQAISPTHAESNAINAAIREKLKQAGRLGSEEVTVTRLKPVSLTEAQKADALAIDGLVAVFFRNKGAFKAGSRVTVTPENAAAVAKASTAAAMYEASEILLAKGEVVRATANGKATDGSRVTNGASYTVAGFGDGTILLEGGKELAGDFGFLSHGYCGTSHSLQGKTVDVVLASMSKASLAAVGSDTAYVSMTRGRHFGYLYTDSMADLRTAAARDRSNANARDSFDPVRERVTFLNRVRQVAEKAREFVRQLTTERDYGR